MKNFSYIFLLLIAISTIAGCAEETIESLQPTPAYKKMISWSVVSNNTQPGGRALMNNTLLQEACTPTIGGESIGIWGDFTVRQDNEYVTFKEFNATQLVYAAKAEDSNPTSDWNYLGKARYWENAATYNFRACYPQELMTNLMTEIGATILQGGPINTSTIQEDILVAATQVNTLTANLSKPVELNMESA